MTGLGLVVTVLFLACYVALTVTSGLTGGRANVIRWAVWALALLVMWACYLTAPPPAG